MALIAEALTIADQLKLGLVGIALDSALGHLSGNGLAAEADESELH